MGRLILNILIVLLIAAAAFVGWRIFSKQQVETTTTSALTSSGNGTIQELPIDRQFLADVVSLKSLKLDASIFDDQVFNSLQDLTVPISLTAAGRVNPFAPI